MTKSKKRVSGFKKNLVKKNKLNNSFHRLFNKTFLFFLIIIFLCFMLFLFNKTKVYHTTLLTVDKNTFKGGLADVYLSIRPGSGKVFVETYPMAKIDTLFSTRFAKKVACDITNKNCDNYDFFYVIRANSTVVAGPSAGAALTILTIAALDDLSLNKDVAMTGTINPGYLVGPVAGVLAKSKAAKDSGFIKKVLIPGFVSLGLEEFQELALKENFSINYSKVNFSEAYDNKLISSLNNDAFLIIRVYDIYDALPYFFNKKFKTPRSDFKVNNDYKRIMKNISKILCGYRSELINELNNSGLLNSSLLNYTTSKDALINNSFSNNDFYAAASFCFSQSVFLRAILLNYSLDHSNNNITSLKNNLFKEISSFEKKINNKSLLTISDLETTAIVKERIREAKELLENANSSYELAFAFERFNSARAWSLFYNMKSKKYVLNKEHLRDACYSKLGLADEKLAYLTSFLNDNILLSLRKDYLSVRKELEKQDYVMCLYDAMKLNARTDLIISISSINKERLKMLIDKKLIAVARSISREEELGLFPIAGYSYYEYASALKDNDPLSALTFTEQALELSNLHLFFPEKKDYFSSFFFLINYFINYLIIFFIGFFFALLIKD